MNKPPKKETKSKRNVVVRLRQRLSEARENGFRIRMEMLGDEQATWCVIAGVPTLFVDLSQTAAEQLRQVEETLAAYHAQKSAEGSPRIQPESSRREDADFEKRAA